MTTRKSNGWPKGWPRYYNACQDPCDTIDGPCVCGAWHHPGEFEFFYGKLRRHGEIVASWQTSEPSPVIREFGPCPEAVKLTPMEALVLVRLEMQNKEIAKDIDLSCGRVEDIIKGILQKLKCRTRTAAALKAVQLGYIRLEMAEPAVQEKSFSQKTFAERLSVGQISHNEKRRILAALTVTEGMSIDDLERGMFKLSTLRE